MGRDARHVIQRAIRIPCQRTSRSGHNTGHCFLYALTHASCEEHTTSPADNTKAVAVEEVVDDVWCTVDHCLALPQVIAVYPSFPARGFDRRHGKNEEACLVRVDGAALYCPLPRQDRCAEDTSNGVFEA